MVCMCDAGNSPCNVALSSAASAMALLKNFRSNDIATQAACLLKYSTGDDCHDYHPDTDVSGW